MPPRVTIMVGGMQGFFVGIPGVGVSNAMMMASDAFLHSAKSAFSFLVSNHGFEIAEIIAPSVVASNLTFYKLMYRRNHWQGNLFVSLTTCPVRLELDLDLGFGWPPKYENTISICELLAVESPGFRLALPFGVYSAFGDPEKMTAQYVAIADSLQQFGRRFFACNESLWHDVRTQRRKQTELRHLDEVSQLAERAFKDKDWPRTIELIESLGDNRTKLQLSRLTYAKKQNAK